MNQQKPQTLTHTHTQGMEIPMRTDTHTNTLQNTQLKLTKREMKHTQTLTNYN